MKGHRSCYQFTCLCKGFVSGGFSVSKLPKLLERIEIMVNIFDPIGEWNPPVGEQSLEIQAAESSKAGCPRKAQCPRRIESHGEIETRLFLSDFQVVGKV